ncbi:MAG: hypothetical protein ACM31C_30765 [Acidobacteriota bacterium]
MGFGSLLKPVENLLHVGGSSASHADDHAAAAPHPVAPAPTTQGTAQTAANGLGANDRGPRLNPLWNHLMGGPGPQAGDGRPLSVNHIGTRVPGPIHEGGPVSTAMRDTPYLGDYWEALSVTHDSRHIHNDFLNGLTAVTNVGLTGPLMGLVDAPFRAFGHSLFLDNDHK